MASWEEFSRIVSEAKSSKKLDPVGQEDDDVDNDGDSDSSDSYLKKRRATVGAAIAADKKKKVSEALDPVGQEDKDIDNDGDHDKSDKYLLNRRKVRSKVIPPQEKLKTDRNMFNIPKSEQEAARERILAKTKAKMKKEEVEFVEEDKEYRREMRKAAARERAEEKRERKNEGKKSAKTPGRLGKSAGTSYADKEHLSIKGHDEVTKKSKHTVGNPFPENYETNGEYIEEKSLSRAQQRFMGMVYAAKKGGTPASPEVAKAASGMSKKAAKDFAKTKHEGLPEKKEDTKEELSLLDKIIVEASEAQFMAAKARREERSKKHQGRLHKAKVATKANKMMKDEVKEKESSKENKENSKKEKAKEEVKTRNTATERAARTSAAGRVKAARIAREAEKEKETARTERQRERLSYTEKSKKEREEKKSEQEKKREEKSAAKEAAKAKRSEAKAKQKELERKEKEKIERSKQKEKSRKSRRSELSRDVKSAWSKPIKVSGDKKDTEAVAAGVSNAASLAAGVAKTGLALGKYAYKKSKEKRGETNSKPSKSEKKEPVKSESKPETTPTEKVPAKNDVKKTDKTPKKLSGTPERKKLVPSTKKLPPAGGTTRKKTEMTLGQKARKNSSLKASLIKDRMEEFSNWREEFIFEVDDQSVKEPKEKMIDVTKKKNKIEINPNMSEGMTLKDFKKKRSAQKQKEKRAAEKTSPLRRAGIHDDKSSPERDARHRANVDPDFDGDDSVNYPGGKLKNPKKIRKAKALGELGESAAWTKKEGKSEAGGLNEKGRKSYERENPGSDLKAPSKKVGNPRRASFCARMSGMKAKLTSKKTANDPDSRINKSLRAWNC